jgi:hypothetical protein
LLGNATLVGKPFDEVKLADLLANALNQWISPPSSLVLVTT